MDKTALEAELKALETKWKENLKSRHNAGGNSKDNERAMVIRALLK